MNKDNAWQVTDTLTDEIVKLFHDEREGGSEKAKAKAIEFARARNGAAGG